MFNETREALQQQTATADVLKVIASSPTEIEPALKTIVESACRFCGAYDATLLLKEGNYLHYRAHSGPIPFPNEAHLITRQWVTGRSLVDKIPVQVSDHLSPETAVEFPEGHRRASEQGHRCSLAVPLLKVGEAIGAITLRRREPVGFDSKQVALLQTFADQAVIAIENARLFNEVQARTRDLQESLQQQTATAEVLQVISSSPSDLAPVFDTMLENATRVCGAEFGSMNLLEGDMLRQVALYNAPSAFRAQRTGKAFWIHPRSSLAEAIRGKQVVQVDDMRKHPAYLEGNPSSVELTELAGARTIVVVPMLQKDEVIGLITVYRQVVRPFNEKQIELLTNFSRQVVIAIENTRLLRELRQRTEDLSKSLDDLRTAQDRLVQTEKLASLGQLTAGIAHEIKNPLNFVNNFSALSVELTDELNDLLKQETLSAKGRGELDELTGLLKDNLSKVVQHGKRADSIVKNMLLHSREGSTERRPAEINKLVEESLNLAYHGARAEKGDFTITIKHDLDPQAGALELYPQEVTRALLNVISNGFYAASKRKSDGSDEAFKPVLSAATRNLGKAIEIRIRDNGTGIPPEVREKMFNPFFTTKPTGEGTGLGLSMTHDIIVKQHGGRIDVETEPGVYTEFIITLPRKGSSATGQPE